MTNNELLEKLQDHFGFEHFVVIGTVEGDSEDHDQLHVMSNGTLDAMSIIWLFIEAMQFMLMRIDDESGNAVH